MFKKVDKRVLKVQTDRVYEAIKYLKSKSITETNNLIKATSVWVNFLERESKGELGLRKKHKLSELNERYGVKRKGLKTVIEELKQRLLAKSAEIRRYGQRIEQFRQNRIFDFDQKKIYAEFNGSGVRSKMCQMRKKVKVFGVIFGVSKKGITERQNGRKI